MGEAKKIKSGFPAPDTESWYQYIWRERQETPNRLEDAAKFLAGMISISLSIFMAVGKAAFGNYQDSKGIQTAVLFWLLSLLLSFFVLFPWRYKYVSESVKSIKEAHGRIVFHKRVLLILSLAFFLAALGVLGWSLFG